MTRASDKPAPQVGVEYSEQVTIRLPEPHLHQRIFTDWHELHPDAQVLVAPCGVKTGKSFGSSLWLLTQALANENFYCVWVAPTRFKAKIGYRYMKAMLPDIPLVRCVDGKLEIHLANGSVIYFLHGRDAEVTVEGEAIDAFVVDEAGKQTRQLWLSIFTTITQTMGRGIITGTPRGFTWYAEIFKMAKAGDPFFCWTQLSTDCSPFVTPAAIANAKRLLPKNLFDQYYKALFISFSTVFGELDDVWDDTLTVEKPNVWLHPDAAQLAKDTVTGADWAKVNDFTVFTTINSAGVMVGFYRFRGGSYLAQVRKLRAWMSRFKGDRSLEFDATGVGKAIEDIIADEDIDANVNGVTFTQQSKQEMVTRASTAMALGWLKAPRIEVLESELTMLEVTVGKGGHARYAAPEGEHDDCAWSLMLAVNGAFGSWQADETEGSIEAALAGRLGKKERHADDLTAYAGDAAGDVEDDDLDELDGEDDFDDGELDD